MNEIRQSEVDLIAGRRDKCSQPRPWSNLNGGRRQPAVIDPNSQWRRAGSIQRQSDWLHHPLQRAVSLQDEPAEIAIWGQSVLERGGCCCGYTSGPGDRVCGHFGTWHEKVIYSC